MFMYLRFILTLALISVISHPSVAQPSDELIPGFGSVSTFISGKDGEKLRFVVLLDPFAIVDGKTIATPAADCELSFKFELFEAEDLVEPVFVENVVLSAGDIRIISFEFVGPPAERIPHVVRRSEVRSFGLCQILSFAELTDADGNTKSCPICGTTVFRIGKA